MFTSSCLCKSYFYKKEVLFSMINNLGTTSSEQQINFGALQIDIENSATGISTIGKLDLFYAIYIKWNEILN